MRSELDFIRSQILTRKDNIRETKTDAVSSSLFYILFGFCPVPGCFLGGLRYVPHTRSSGSTPGAYSINPFQFMWGVFFLQELLNDARYLGKSGDFLRQRYESLGLRERLGVDRSASSSDIRKAYMVCMYFPGLVFLLALLRE